MSCSNVKNQKTVVPYVLPYNVLVVPESIENQKNN